MFRSRHIYLIIVGLLLSLNAQQLDKARVSEYIGQAMEKWNVPGLAIAVVHGDSIIYSTGFGYRDRENSLPIDKNTIFAVASNTKAFTAAALGLLVQEGKLSWNDPIVKHLPDFQMQDPAVTPKITVRDMLSHRSGLGLWAGDLTWWDSIFDRKEVIHKIRFNKQVFDLQTGYAYTNLAFVAAGEVIPAITDTSWEEFVKVRFFDPLGMSRTTTNVEVLDGMENVAVPYVLKDGELHRWHYTSVSGSAPAAAINSSALDMAQWLRLQLKYGSFNGLQILDSATVFQTRNPQTLLRFGPKSLAFNPASHFITYGLGWFLRDYHGRLLVNHGGGLDGMFSYTGFIPEDDIGVVVLTNSDDHNLSSAIALYIFDRMLDVPFVDWGKKYLDRDRESRARNEKREAKMIAERNEESRPSHELSAYVGSYSDDILGIAHITLEDDQLLIRFTSHPKIEGRCEHWQYDTFVAKWNDMVWDESKVHFDTDDKGQIHAFRLRVRPDWVDTHEYEFVKEK